MARNTIALNIIMRDVADTILPCLNSVGTDLDKYIFVDTGSKDNTKELVLDWCQQNKLDFKIIDYKGYKASPEDRRKRKSWGDIPQYEWDFGDARQIALVNSETDWIFWLDSDDVAMGMENLRQLVADAEMSSSSMVNLPYHYAQDEHGNDVIYQYRERLIKIRFDGKTLSEWRMRVHEFCQVPGEYLGSILVRQDVHIFHKRTMQHVIETNRRNNRILYYALEQEDAAGKREMRTLSVLAFDHYEHREWEESIKYYKQLFDLVMKEQSMAEPQYMSHYSSYARACIAVRDYDQAHKCLERMIALSPQLAEPYILKADIYLQQNNLELCEEYIKLAETRPPMESMSPMSPLELKVKPLLLRVELAGRKGDLKAGVEYLSQALAIVPNDGNLLAQRRNMLNNLSVKDAYDGVFALREELYNTGEISKMLNLVAAVPESLLNRQEINSIMGEMRGEWEADKQRHSVKLSGPKKITIFVGQAYEEWNPEIIKAKGSGGSEEMCVRIAKELAALGNKVKVYNQCGLGNEGTFEGVEYIDYRKFNENEACDVFISERVPSIFVKRINAKRQYLWLHDTHYGEMPRKFYNLPDKVFVLSEAHKHVLKEYYDFLKDERFYVTRNGIELEMIEKGEALNSKRDQYKLIYSSSYDRGIDRLLALFPEIKKREPKATLDIFYGFEVYDKRMNHLLKAGDPEGRALQQNKERLLKLMEQPGVTHHGRVTQQELINNYFKAGVWAYPTGFYEISCQPAGSLVFTKKGMLPIERVGIGDLVLTHKGRFMPVTALIKKHNDKGLVGLRRKKDFDTMYFTPEHELLASRVNKRSDSSGKRTFSRTEKSCGWVASSELKESLHWLNTPKNVCGTLEYINISDYVPGLLKEGEFVMRKKHPLYIKVKDRIRLDRDFAWIMGYFCAQGSAAGAKLRHGKIQWLSAFSFASHIKHIEQQKRVRRFFTTQSLLVRDYSASQNGVTQRVHSSVWAHFLRNVVGVGREKRIPEFIWDCPLDIQAEFIKGMRDGDGSFSEKTNTISYVSVSVHLARGLIQLLANQGILPSIHFDGKRRAHTLSWQDNDQNSHVASIDFGDKIGTRLIDKVDLPTTGEVYDLEVAEDHSYVCNNTIVHNCITGMIAQSCGAIPVVSDYAALSETVQYGSKLPMGYSDEDYIQAVVKMLQEPIERKGMMDWARKQYDVNPLAKEWDKYFES